MLHTSRKRCVLQGLTVRFGIGYNLHNVINSTAQGCTNFEQLEKISNNAKNNAKIDLGAIAKGYIADKVAEFLESKGVTSAVVDLGGNIVVIGEKGESIDNPVGTEFKVGIADPNSEGLLGLLECKDKTVVTSGTYERYFELDGKRYHHVLDTKTGYPADTDLLAVTIVADKGHSVDCDGLSTSCLALGKEKGLKLIQGLDGVQAIFIDKDGKVTKSDESLKLITQ